MSHILESHQMLDWLRRAGLVPENTRRAVIDIKADDCVMIYAELYGTDELLSVEPPPDLHAAKITVIGGK